MRSSLPRTISFLFLSLFLLVPLTTSAECSDHEMTAVMILGSVYPGSEQALETLSVYPVGEHTYPSYEELRSIITEYVGCDFYRLAQESHYLHYSCMPNVSESSAILDVRTGQLPFLGTQSSSGVGQVLVPEISTHGWSMVEGDPAAAPNQISIFRDSDLFDIIPYPVFEEQLMAELLHTDVLHSFAECGDYSVVIFPFTPTVSPVDPLVAKAVVMVNGTCGDPWNSEPVPEDGRSWGSVKSLYR
jgi:hypothetical protein